MRKLYTTTIVLSLIFATSCKNDTMKNIDAKLLARIDAKINPDFNKNQDNHQRNAEA